MERRTLLKLLLGGASWLVLFQGMSAAWAESIRKITMSNDEWKKKLTPEQYHVLREEGTERPFSSPLNKEKGEGVFVCAGCDLPLFPSHFKYDSGTGWPSFFDSIPGSI
jgi:peptide-methionine (R)-S-oxide reductase